MSANCRHPERPGLVCDRRGNHPVCSGFDPDGDDFEYVDWTNTDYVPPVTVPEKAAKGLLRGMAARVAPAPAPTAPSGFTAALEGSTRAGNAWDDHQKKLVDDAIRWVCEQHSGGGEFTTDAIWARLGGAVPVTKGLTARLQRARRDGLLDTTGKTTITERGGENDHAQRLTIWYSLLS
jgi:hypothetical protein